MKNVGIICYLPYTRSIVISIYYHAIKNLYDNVKIVEKLSDLEGLDMLFIGNDHFGHHTLIWNNSEFVNICNKNNIEVIVIGAEKIKNTVYPQIDEMFDRIHQINKSKYYVWDVEDSKLLNKDILGYAASKYYKNCVEIKTKKNKCLFIGQYEPIQYEERRQILKVVNNYIETDIITNFNGDWKEYLELYSQYKYALCPISGNSNSIPFRFYEAMLVDTIPILQVREDTLDYFPEEKQLEDCIFFKNIKELPKQIENFKYDKCYSKLWLENKIKNKLKQDGIYLP